MTVPETRAYDEEDHKLFPLTTAFLLLASKHGSCVHDFRFYHILNSRQMSD